MSRRIRSLVSLLGTTATLSACSLWLPPEEDHSSRPADPPQSALSESFLADVPLSFVENRGQTDERAIFHLSSSHTTMAFTETGLALTLASHSRKPQPWALRQEFVRARPTRPVGQRRLDGVVSYFTGSPDQWRTNIPTYGAIVYRDLWEGIDVVYAGGKGSVKYDVRLEPEADPDDIRLRWRGATDLRIEEDGPLSVVTPAGTLMDAAPAAYQVIGGRRVPVRVWHELEGFTMGFGLGAYDASRPLVIDPNLAYAGYIGGTGDEGLGSNVAVDSAGAAYVVGQTTSEPATFPETVGPFLTKGAGTDAFVAKVAPGGGSLVYAGYIGGAGDESAFGIAVDTTGAAYLTGQTTSDETTFPDTIGPDLTKGAGPDDDAFAAKLNPAGTGLVYAGFIGGDGVDLGFGIAVDEAGAAYVTGYTDSATGFPVTGGPATVKGALSDAFVSKVLPTGTGFAYSGYIGGDGDDEGNSIAVDKSGAAYVTGDTDSDESTFPDMGGPDLSFNGVLDGFVAKVNTAGSGLVYAGYIGGDALDVPLSIAVDDASAAFITGFTFSAAATFPETVGPFLTHSGGRDAFVAKVVPSGASLAYAGYLGGAGDDRGHAIAVDSFGAAYVAGRTNSDAATFPEKAGPFLTPGGGIDAFAAKVNAGGTGLVYAGYLGGSGTDIAYGIDVDASGAAYIAGETASFPALVGPDVSHNGGGDAFVAKITAECRGIPATVVGTDGDDVLAGTAANDVIVGYAGNDTIDGGAGDDLVCGGDGSDTISGGDGVDTLDGEGGSDFILGGGGRDTASGGPGKDTVKGEAGADRVNGGGADDRLSGGIGSDRMNGGGGSDRLTGGKGNDRLNGGGQADRLNGNNGNDRLNGGAGNDRLTGGKGHDSCHGGRGIDQGISCRTGVSIP